MPARLGVGLATKLVPSDFYRKTIWLHALSVGEVTSAVPLIAGLRKTYPNSRIVVSVTTRSGRGVADNLLSSLADHVIDGPMDILPVVVHFFTHIRPDLFILIETDLWPNTLIYLKKKNVPTLLVNGRVSQKAIEGYKRLRFFFNPMFQSFSFLCMQTQHDKDKMVDLGLPAERLRTLGNLKFDTLSYKAGNSQPATDLLPQDRIIFICGSTHPGEEQILIESYCQVRKKYPQLSIIIAPRDIGRASEIQSLAQKSRLSVSLRSDKGKAFNDVLILNTIGELIHFYALAHIGFVGGSLVKKGGHNPIEPATMGLPVIFGPNMQDFSEIAEALIATGGATQVLDEKQLTVVLSSLLSSPRLLASQGLAAQQCVASQRGVIDKHLALIRQLL